MECTIKSSEYHPHLHCIFVLKKKLKLPAIYSNAYSFNYGAFENKFSELEILIQKVWYLINNNIRVNAISISGLSIGYSCIADKVVGNDYAEVFKYITKLTKQDNTDNLMTYEQFITLYFSLFSRRQIQSYGCLYKIPTDDSLNLTREDILKLIVAKLKIVEDPVFVSSKIDDVIKSLKDKHYTIISKHSLEKFLDLSK